MAACGPCRFFPPFSPAGAGPAVLRDRFGGQSPRAINGHYHDQRCAMQGVFREMACCMTFDKVFCRASPLRA